MSVFLAFSLKKPCGVHAVCNSNRYTGFYAATQLLNAFRCKLASSSTLAFPLCRLTKGPELYGYSLSRESSPALNLKDEQTLK